MRTWLKITAVTVASCAFSILSFASPPNSYYVSAKLSHAGKPFAAPSVTVHAGQPASMEVSGPDGYKLTLTITDVAPDEVQVAASLDSPHGAMEPTMVVRLDQSASVSADDLDLELVVRRNGG
jgi:hypothetical protein